MKRWMWALPVLLSGFVASAQQNVIGDVLTGNLVKPKEGQWAWYDLKDATTGLHYSLRQAIVGSEKVGGKTGYWVELEIAPVVGHKTVYKMLLTGPASDPKHLHRVIAREGLAAPQELQLAGEPEDKDAKRAAAPRQESLGTEDIETQNGVINAEHLRVTTEDKVSEVWVNEKVRPMGIVRMLSPEGELVLRSYGEGGDDARSIIDDDAAMSEGRAVPEPKVEVRVGGEKVPSDGGAAPRKTPEATANEAVTSAPVTEPEVERSGESRKEPGSPSEQSDTGEVQKGEP